MDYELAKRLKDAGFPQKEFDFHNPFSGKGWPGDVRPAEYPYNPTLEELIEACIALQPDAPFRLYIKNGKCRARMFTANTHQEAPWFFGSTPIEAVARLWLALHANGDASA